VAEKPGRCWQVVRRGLVRAEELVRNPKELLGLLTVAERRLDRIHAGPLNPLKEDLQTLLRMLQASGEGRYRECRARTSPWPPSASSTLVSPLDLIPDFLPGGSPTTPP